MRRPPTIQLDLYLYGYPMKRAIAWNSKAANIGIWACSSFGRRRFGAKATFNCPGARKARHSRTAYWLLFQLCCSRPVVLHAEAFCVVPGHSTCDYCSHLRRGTPEMPLSFQRIRVMAVGSDGQRSGNLYNGRSESGGPELFTSRTDSSTNTRVVNQKKC